MTDGKISDTLARISRTEWFERGPMSRFKQRIAEIHCASSGTVTDERVSDSEVFAVSDYTAELFTTPGIGSKESHP